MATDRRRKRLPSYTSQLSGPVSFAREAYSLWRAHGSNHDQRVSALIQQLQEMEEVVAARTGIRLEHLEMLDVGAGQRLIQMTYFASRGNRVMGIDRDLIVRGFDPAGYVRMARTNGTRRVAKTLGRKLVGIDGRYAAELRRQLGRSPDPSSMRVLQMDATDLSFADASFDFAYSFTVLQYVDDPRRALGEIARVVRPGGGVYADFLPFTGEIGSFDIRVLGGVEEAPPWAHLRPALAGTVSDTAYLNRLRLDEWRSAFETAMPACDFIQLQPRREQLEPLAHRLHEQGELVEYAVDELVTSRVMVVWRKPPAGAARPASNTASADSPIG